MSYTLTKAQITHIKQLHDNKSRKEFGVYIAEGEKILKELLKFPEQIEQVYATTHLPFPHILISAVQMQKISALQTPTNVLIVCKLPPQEIILPNSQFTLVLDGIQDPGNMGSIVRIADWYGIANVICSLESADAYSPKAVQASMGSIVRVKVHRLDLNIFLKQHHSIPKYVAMLNGKDVSKLHNSQPGFIIIGSEGKGVSEAVLNACEHHITIPGAGVCESLNAAIACGIICSHLIKI